MTEEVPSKPGEVRVRLLIDGRWTAGDFSRVFDLLSETNALISAISLDRLSVRHKGDEALYLRRALRPDDPKVLIESVQFGSPGSILARLPGAVHEVWDLLKDLLWRHKTEKAQAQTAVVLKQEELVQARLRTEALRLDLERQREEVKQAKLGTAGSLLDLSRREEELARAVVEARLETAAAVLEAIEGFHRRTGVPYTLIEKYLAPRLDALSQDMGYLVSAGLLEGVEAAPAPMPPAVQQPGGQGPPV